MAVTEVLTALNVYENEDATTNVSATNAAFLVVIDGAIDLLTRVISVMSRAQTLGAMEPCGLGEWLDLAHIGSCCSLMPRRGRIGEFMTLCLAKMQASLFPLVNFDLFVQSLMFFDLTQMFAAIHFLGNRKVAEDSY